MQEPQVNGLIEPREFFATGCPFFNYKKFIFKLYYVDCLRQFFGFGKKKFFQILSRECCNAKFSAVQVVECYMRVVSLSCDFLNKKSHYVSSRLERILKSLDKCFQYVSDQLDVVFRSKYDMMKTFVTESVNDVIKDFNQDEAIVTNLQQELNQLKKEKEIDLKEKQWLTEENLNLKNQNQKLRDLLSIDRSEVDFENIAQQRKQNALELEKLKKEVPVLKTSNDQLKRLNEALTSKVKTLQLDIVGYKEALADVNEIESENSNLIQEMSSKKREFDYEIEKLKKDLRNSKSYCEQDYSKLKIMMTQIERENILLHEKIKEMEDSKVEITPSGSRNFSTKSSGNSSSSKQVKKDEAVKALFLFSLPSNNKSIKNFVKSMKLQNNSFKEYLTNLLQNNSSNFYVSFETICKTLDGFYYV